MIKSNYTTALAAGLVSVLSIGAVLPSGAQHGPRDYQRTALTAIKEGKWQEALDAVDRCIRVYEPRIKMLGLDDGFGWFYYQKGVCLAQLKNYKEAVEAFKACYTKFPSAKNQLVKMALFREGENYCRLGDFAKGAELLEKFLKEYRSNPVARNVNAGEVQGLLAQCYFKMSPPAFEKGMENLTSCVTSRYKGRRITDAVITNGFLAMVDAAIKTGKCSETVKFVENYPSVMNISPTRVALYAPRLVSYVAEVLEKSRSLLQDGKQKESEDYASLAMVLMGLLPDQSGVMADANYSLDRLGRANGAVPGVTDFSHTLDRAKVTALIDQFNKMKEEGKVMDAFTFSFMGNQALVHGSQRVARAAYQLINESYPDAPGREDNLYYLAMTTWQLGEADKGGELVAQHLKEFPNSKYAPMLNTLSLEGLLKEKKFDLCVQQADKVMELHKDDPTHKFYELALYCKGASLFNLGAADASRYKEAVPVLERFVKEYRDSTYLKTAMYLLGETYTNLGNTDEAIRSFTNYIARFPDKGEANMAAVLYDRAFNYLNRKNPGDEELAAKDAKEIVDNFKDHRLFPYANNLLANLCAGSKEHEQEAEGYFLAALESAKKLGDKRPAVEAVYNLFINATKKPLPVEPKEAVETARTARRDEVKKWYDEYWKDSDQPGSRYSLQLAAAAMDFFKDDKEMFDPASVKMQEIIVREGKKDDPKMTVLLEEAVNSYTKTYMAGNQALGRNLDANAMRNHFYRFPGVDNDKDKTLSAMLRMAVIAQTQERYEKAPVETDEQRAEKAALEGLVKQLFVELKRDFKPSDLPPYTLVKLGMHLAGTSQPEESISYFDEILDPSEPDPVRKKARINGMSKYRKNAVFGKAVALGRSKDNAKVDTAIKMMRDELSKEESSSNPDRKAMEDAQYNLVKFTSARQDWPAVIAAADKYRENKTYKKNLPEVLYLQGEAYLKQNELDKALINFMNITGTYKGLVKWSAPAVLAQMDTLWKRNTMSQGAGKQPSDRYVAWKAGSQYVQLLDTPANRKKMTAEDSALVNEVKDKTAKFGSDPAVSQERADIAAYEAAVRAAKGQK